MVEMRQLGLPRLGLGGRALLAISRGCRGVYEEEGLHRRLQDQYGMGVLRLAQLHQTLGQGAPQFVQVQLCAQITQLCGFCGNKIERLEKKEREDYVLN